MDDQRWTVDAPDVSRGSAEVDVIPAAASNVWWIDLMPGESFSYNLRRVGTDRYFSIKFDLKTQIKSPEAPWGWKD